MAIRWDSISVGERVMRAYVGVPEGGGRKAGVLIAQHGPGLDGFVQDVVHRLFRAGYVAAAPDLYHRQPPDVPDALARVGMLKDDEIIADMNATVAHMQGLGAERIGVTGFCMGGRVAYLMAAVNRELAACAVFYGGDIMAAWGGPPTPFERSKDIGCPIIGFFGAADVNPSPDDVDRIDAELTRLGKPHELHRYAGAGHAFQNFLNPDRYRERAARASWGELLAFFAEHLTAFRPSG